MCQKCDTDRVYPILAECRIFRPERKNLLTNFIKSEIYNIILILNQDNKPKKLTGFSNGSHKVDTNANEKFLLSTAKFHTKILQKYNRKQKEIMKVPNNTTYLLTNF